MESSKVFIKESSIKVVNEEEIKKKIIEDYLNYREISEAITKRNTTINFIFVGEQNKVKYWEIQTLSETKEDGIILLKSSLGEFYVNRDRKKGKIQYLNMKESKENLVDEEKLIGKELTEAKAMKEATAENVIEFIYKRIICTHGCPKVILSDRGTHFRNKLVDGLCEKFEIKHKLSSPYHPQTNGLVERFNRTLCESLAKVSRKEDEWDEHIESVLFAYRTTKHNTTKKTPFFMVYGQEAILPIEEFKNGKDFGKNAIIKRTYDLINLVDERIKALENIERSQEQQKNRHDIKIKKEVKFEIGDKILLKDVAKEKQWSGKLSPKWKGPYYIHEIIGKGAYKLRTLEGKVLKNPYNIKHLKKYFDRRDNIPLVYV